MNKQKWLILVTVFVLLGGTALFLGRLQNFQRLGAPGVRTKLVEEGKNAEVVLPEQVLDYTSEPIEVAKVARDMLPKDTCFGQRFYRATDGFGVQVNVVLMGSDRTSIHRAERCLRGSGYVVGRQESAEVLMTRPTEYSLPVTKLSLVPEPGSPLEGRRAVYVYWFVADNEYTGSQAEWMKRMFWNLATKGVLQRWAYISCIAECLPGQEDATFERLKKMIAASAPEFQLTPRAPGAIAGVAR
jgi:hypothetical protein